MLRKALGEGARREYIETVPRRGYRFIAHVRILDRTAAKPFETLDRSEVLQSNSKELLNAKGIAPRQTDHDEARHLYVRGRYYCSKYTVNGLNRAVDYFRQAIKLEPRYASPYVGLAECYYRLANVHLSPYEALPKAKAAAIEAIKNDEGLPEAHTLLGLVRTFYDKDWLAAEKEFERALELNADSAPTYKRYGWALGMSGHLDAAIVQMGKAVTLQPHSVDLLVGLGIILHLARREAEAIAQAQLALDLEPEFFPAHVLSGIGHLQQSEIDIATQELEMGSALGDVPWSLGYLGYGYAVGGRQKQAREILDELNRRTEAGYVSPYALALIYTGLGQKEAAMRSLVEVYAERSEMFGFVKNSPEFDSLRSEKEFIALMK
jgi:serine/threonine-protein kinase